MGWGAASVASSAVSTHKGISGRRLKYGGPLNPESEVERMLSLFRTSSFTVLFEVAADLQVYRPMVMLLYLWDFLQMLAFPLSQVPIMPWFEMPLMRKVYVVLQPVTLNPSAGTTLASASVLYSLGLAWAIGLMGLFAWTAYVYSPWSTYKPVWPVRILRGFLRINTIALFLPVTSSLMSVLSCPTEGYWLDSGQRCWEQSHIGVLVTAAVFIPIYTIFSAAVAALLVQRTANPKNVLAAPHGRAFALQIGIRAATALIFALHPFVDSWVLILAALAAGLGQFYTLWRFLPFYTQRLNNVTMACSGVLLLASGCGVLANILKEPRADVAAWVFLLCSPFAAYVGYGVADQRFRYFARNNELTTPYTVELRARWLCHEIAVAASHSRNTSSHGMSNMHLENKAAENEEQLSGNGGPMGNSLGNTGFGDATGVGISGTAEGSLISEVESLYIDAGMVFAASSLMDVFYAQFFGEVRNNRHLELVHLNSASQKDPAVDVSFWIYQRRRAIEEADMATSGNRMNVMRKMHFEALTQQAADVTMKARAHILSFWSELLEKRPSMARLENQGKHIANAVRRADSAYEQLLDMQPQSTMVMRQYAQFLLEVMNDPHQAHELLADADQIEDEQSRMHMSNTQEPIFNAPAMDFEASNETAGVLRVSGKPNAVGMITDANPAALKLFGYARRELLGKDVATIIPEPIGSVHHKLLARFLQDGKVKVLNATRVLFAVHRAGYMIPVRASIRPMEDGFGGLFEALTTRYSFLAFGPANTGWRVYGMCANSLSALGVDAADVKSGGINMRMFIPNIETVLATLLASDGGAEVKMYPVNATIRNSAGDADGGETPDAAGDAGDVSSGVAGDLLLEAHGTHKPTMTVATGAHAAAHKPSSSSSKCIVARGAAVEVGVTFASSNFFSFRWMPAGAMQGRGRGSASAAASVAPSIADGDTIDDDISMGSSDVDGGASDQADGNNSENEADESRALLATAAGGGRQVRRSSLRKPAAPAATRATTASARSTGSRRVLFHGDDAPQPSAGRAASAGSHRGGATGTSATATAFRDPAPITASSNDAHHMASAAADGFDAAMAAQAAEIAASGNGTACPLGFTAADGAPPPGHAAVFNNSTASTRDSPRMAAVPPLPGSVASPAHGPHSRTSRGSRVAGDGSEPATTPATAPAVPAVPAVQLPTEQHAATTHEGHTMDHTATEKATAIVPGVLQKSRSKGPGALMDRSGSELALLRRASSQRLRSFQDKVDNGTNREGRIDLSQPIVVQPVDDDPNKGHSSHSGEHPGRSGKGHSHSAPGVQPVHKRQESSVSGRGSIGQQSKEGGKPRGPGSVGSRGSGTSGRSGSSAVDSLRRQVEFTSNSMEPSLVNLRRALLSIFMVTAVMNVVSLVVTRLNFQALMHNNLDMHANGDRAIELQQVYQTTQRLALAKNGLFNYNVTTDGQELKDALVEQLDSLNSLHRELYYTNREASPAEQLLYASNSVAILDLVPGSWINPSKYNATKRYINMMNAGIEYVSKGKLLATRPMSELGPDSQYIWWLEKNGDEAILDAFNTSMLLADARSSTTSDTIWLMSLSVLCVALSLFVVVTLAIMLPAVSRVLRTKFAIFNTFLAVPLPILRALRTQCNVLLEAARRQAAADDEDGAGEADEGDVQLDVEEQTAIDWNQYNSLWANVQAAREGIAVVAAAADDAGVKTANDGGIATTGSGGAATNTTTSSSKSRRSSSKRVRTFQESSHMGTSMLIQLLLPIAAMMGYYAGKYFWVTDVNEQARHGRIEVLWSKQIEVAVGQIGFHTRNILGFCDDDYMIDNMAEMRRISKMLSRLNDGILYGDESMDFRPGLQLSSDLARLFLVNGCLNTKAPHGGELPPYTMSECENFYDGLMTQGLQAAFTRYLQLAEEVVADREALMHSGNCTPHGVHDPRDPRPLRLEELSSRYLAFGFGVNSDIHHLDLTGYLTSFLSYDILTTVASCVALIVFYILIYRPLILRLDAEIKSVRKLLLLFPDQIARNVLAIADGASGIIANTGLGPMIPGGVGAAIPVGGAAAAGIKA